jgi:hypothetical protein
VQPLSYSAPSGNMLGTSILGNSLAANDYSTSQVTMSVADIFSPMVTKAAPKDSASKTEIGDVRNTSADMMQLEAVSSGYSSPTRLTTNISQLKPAAASNQMSSAEDPLLGIHTS